ncbi:MAG: hypothetical protein WCI96_14675, partial [Planctomycetota bacterium]
MRSIAHALASVLALALVVAPARAEVEPAVRELVAVRGEPLLVEVRVGAGKYGQKSCPETAMRVMPSREESSINPMDASTPTPQADGG